MVKSATTVTSAVEKFTEIPTAIADAAGLTGNSPTDIISSDSKYKYFPRWQRSLMTASGVLNNIQTWGSSRGNDKVGRWYFDIHRQTRTIPIRGRNSILSSCPSKHEYPCIRS